MLYRMTLLEHLWVSLTYIEWLIRIVMVPVILRRHFAPTTSLAWLAVIFLSPEIGLGFYFLLGDARLGKRRARSYTKLMEQVRLDAVDAMQREYIMRPEVSDAQMPLVLQAESTGGMPIVGGNHVEVLGSNAIVIDRLVKDIDFAQNHVHLLFYIYENDDTGTRIADALRRATARGVKCRVLADAAGSLSFFSSKGLAQKLRSEKIEVLPSLPVGGARRKLARIDLRNHRKLAVIDGLTAYMGSQNIVDSGYGGSGSGSWVDIMGRFTGPIVPQMQSVFVRDWHYETGKDLATPQTFPTQSAVGRVAAQTVPTGPSHAAEQLPRVLLTAINSARQRLTITSPYIIPDEATMISLAMAADRGVEVILIGPARADHPLVFAAGHYYYDEMLESGVQIYHYRPGMLHSKTMTVDDSFAFIGSANLDIRSLHLNFELNVLLYGSQITHELRSTQQSYLNDSVRITLETWRRRPKRRRYVESVAALLSPLL